MKFYLLLCSLTVLFCSAKAFPPAPIVKVAIIDTGLDLTDPRFSSLLCRGESKDFTGTGLTDNIGHGTHVAGLIKAFAGNAPYCLMILKFYVNGASGSQSQERLMAAVKYAAEHGAKYVNFSGGGPGGSEAERRIFAEARDVTFIVAAGNNHKDLEGVTNEDGFYPASYSLPNVIAVGGLSHCPKDSSCTRWSGSNYGLPGMVWELGERVLSSVPCKLRTGEVPGCNDYHSGTSMATAIHTGKLIAGEGQRVF